MTQYAFYFNQDACVGCKACQVACKETYKLGVNNLYRKVYDYQGGSWDLDSTTGVYAPQGVFGYFTSIACNHCKNPACVETCPTGAMQKDEGTGIVWTDHEICIGCKSCAAACPYDAPTFGEEEGYMLKCDMCKDRVAREEVPVCVGACTMRALDWGSLDDMVAKYGEGDIEVEPLPENTTNPNLILTPHRDAQKSGSGTGSVVNLEEEL
ncbi:4Fe-4S dicluster domain-containing protein [uncultured Adlercreutzia sp.]|uniref:4Fe-4S dicluster domain-containing protein n=1 Tax=uncultured Adlercreutzia sp. TaxID=875803 RepID=UPI00266D7304|nr:4Fe-4S dicluster domain-containing protein [uncultured Adlercreutzia sp.]